MKRIVYHFLQVKGNGLERHQGPMGDLCLSRPNYALVPFLSTTLTVARLRRVATGVARYLTLSGRNQHFPPLVRISL
jgi:hypothetical protein